MRILESQSLTILTTDTCTASCAHCCMNSSPTRRGRLSAPQIRDYIDQAASSTTIKTVIFAGGEPLLLGEDLFLSLERVREKGMRSRLVTNAYWATSESRARDVTRKLRDAGLDELNISIDDFHLPYINSLNVKRAFDAAMLLDFESIIIAHCTGPNTKFNDRELDELLGVTLPRIYDEETGRKRRSGTERESVKRPYVAVSNSNVQYIGRGTVKLNMDDIPAREEWRSEAREVGGCPWAVRSPAISPAGHLLSCCGFEVAGNEVLDIGDLNQHSLAQLLNDADNDLALNVIAIDGPYRIMDFLQAREPGLPFRKQYGSFCELCQHIVTDATIREAFLKNISARAPEIAVIRQAAAEQIEKDLEFEWLYHKSDPVQPARDSRSGIE